MVNGITYQAFAEEILSDLPILKSSYGDSITFTNLKEFYGESDNRIKHAIRHLNDHKHITVHQSVNRSYYITTSPTSTDPLQDFTDMQRSLLQLVMKTCHKATKNSPLPIYAIQTDYRQLGRVLKASHGGIKACLARMHELEYLNIKVPTKIGVRGCMVIEIGRKLMPIYKTQNFDP